MTLHAIDFSHEGQVDLLLLTIREVLSDLQKGGVRIAPNVGDRARVRAKCTVGNLVNDLPLPAIELQVRYFEITEQGGEAYLLLVPDQFQRRYVIIT